PVVLDRLGSPSAATYTVVNPTGTSNEDGYGAFNLTIDAPNSNLGNSASQISFTVTDLGGTWGSVADVLTGNNKGNILAAHVGAWDGVSTGFGTLTGYVDHATLAPEPSTVALAGLGALGFIGYGLRRRLKT